MSVRLRGKKKKGQKRKEIAWLGTLPTRKQEDGTGNGVGQRRVWDAKKGNLPIRSPLPKYMSLVEEVHVGEPTSAVQNKMCPHYIPTHSLTTFQMAYKDHEQTHEYKLGSSG